MHRLFVAIDLPDKVREELAALGFGLPGARWVPADQLHLTVRFIGEVDGGLFKDIMESLFEVRTESFSMQLQGLGHFPPKKTPRVLWVGIEKNESLLKLRNRIESTLVRTGLEPEGRKFSPHISIARLKDPSISRIGNFLAGNSLYKSEPFEVNDFHLYSSTLTQKGAIHQLEASYDLRGNQSDKRLM